METRLEELVFQESQQEEIWSDADLIKLQMLALHGLQQEKADLVSRVKRVEDENKRLVEMKQQQTDRPALVNEYIMRRGLELMRYGEFLVSMVDEKTEPSSL